MHQTTRARWLGRVFLPCLIVLAGSNGIGCQRAPQSRPSSLTRVERFMHAYADLESGRFAIIADFEDPVHMELLDVVNASGRSRCVRDERMGRTQTGRACAVFLAASPDDALVMGNARSTNWYLKRDWRPFDLLLMNLFAPEPDLSLSLSISGGPTGQRLEAETDMPLRRGWNTLRLDLAEIAEHVPLDDVQEIRFQIQGGSKAVEVAIDDLVLTNNRADLLGDSTNTDGQLYVQRVGRRWKIGAGGAFEITFSQGRIIEWFNLAADPYRLKNLVGSRGLGPLPMPIRPYEPGEHRDFADAGAVSTHARILEMNPVRAIVEVEWRLADRGRGGRSRGQGQPFYRWIYTLYPTGQINAFVERAADPKAAASPEQGLGVFLAPRDDGDLQSFVITLTGKTSPGADEPKVESAVACAGARDTTADMFLLYAVRSGKRILPLQRLADGGTGSHEDQGDLTLLATGATSANGITRWTAHLYLGASGQTSQVDAKNRCADVAEACALRLDAGSFAAVTDTPGGRPGFDVVSGAYVIEPENGLVRLVIGGSDHPCFTPAFTIKSTSGKDVWVYVDQMILKRVAQSADGDTVFQIPTIVDKPTLVEVLVR